MGRPALALPLGLAVMAIAANALAVDHVERRGSEPSVTGRITGIDASGVFLVSESGANHFVPWDRVRTVHHERGDPGIERYRKISVDLWRARSRLERGDAVMAEPVFERLFEEYRGQTHETALVAAEGLLRCRLERGANAAAVVPALEAARLRRAGVETDSYVMLPVVIDADTSLSPPLAPAWIATRSLQTLERDLAGYDARGDAVIAEIARLYHGSVRRHLELPPSSSAPADAAPPEATVEHPGVRLLEMVLACDADHPATRITARRRLEHDLPSRAGWTEGWARFALGSSLLRESSRAIRERGMVQLIHVPARFASRQPYLAGLSLAWVAAASREMGDDRAADIVASELAGRFPSHPVRDADDPRSPSNSQDDAR